MAEASEEALAVAALEAAEALEAPGDRITAALDFSPALALDLAFTVEAVVSVDCLG